MLISLKRHPKMALFSKSAAKLLYQTAKTCHYVEKNALFCGKVHFLGIEDTFGGYKSIFSSNRLNLFRLSILIKVLF